ncbi:MerR family transcriptional regulator [Nitratidesulfovibrio sp. HK-II]|nr:hypothetical protein RVX_1357 [Nitratidesulfovibrio sp. HK-II]
MIRELLTLREIARRLDVPPSSIAYYKDRFARFLPAGEGRGRRLRYPVHVLDIFREIRSMYTRNVAAEQIEERLEELTAMLSAQGGPGAQGGQPGDPHRPARTGGVDGAGARASGAGAEPYRRERLQDFDGSADGGTRGFPHGMAQGPDGDQAVEGLPGMLDRMATLLQVQGHMLAELSSLRRQVEELRADRDALLAAFDERAARLDGALELLRRERAEAVTRLVDDYYTAASGAAGVGSRVDSDGGTGANPHAEASPTGSTADGDFSSAQFEAADAGPSSTEAGASGATSGGASGTTSGATSDETSGGKGASSMPPAALFERPLVIRRNGEFLGVSGRDKAFTLRELLALVERHAARRHRVSMGWGRSGSAWVLRMTTDEPAIGRQGGSRTHELTLQPVTTPSGNLVTRLSRLAINGDTVPDRFLLELFRNIRESYEAR